jgi:DNA polymerase-3 subunit gamma/tau
MRIILYQDASHFRDLLVSKTPATLSLLEVGEQAQHKCMGYRLKNAVNFLLKELTSQTIVI